MEYNTPFVGLFLYSPCYIRLLSDLHFFLNQEIAFVKESRYPIANEIRKNHYFPTGCLGNQVEIQFLHYKTQAEALVKWNSRRVRIRFDNLFIGYSDVDLFETKLLEVFERLPLHRKVFFTANPNLKTPSSVFITECANQPQVANLFSKAYLYKRHFDVVDWLNGGSGKPTSLHRVVNRLLETK